MVCSVHRSCKTDVHPSVGRSGHHPYFALGEAYTPTRTRTHHGRHRTYTPTRLPILVSCPSEVTERAARWTIYVPIRWSPWMAFRWIRVMVRVDVLGTNLKMTSPVSLCALTVGTPPRADRMCARLQCCVDGVWRGTIITSRGGCCVPVEAGRILYLGSFWRVPATYPFRVHRHI